jgi:predicted nuclease with TOPRIM domain
MQTSENGPETVEELTVKVDELKQSESSLIAQLEDTIADKEKLQKEIQEQNLELSKLNEEENRFWNEYNYMKKKLFDCEDELQSLDNQLKYAETHLEKIKNTNIYAATFHIW